MITREKLIHYVESLKEKHDELDKRINQLYLSRADDIQVEELKKQKLRLKDEIEKNNKKIN